MKIGGLYSFNGGQEVISRVFPSLLEEIKGIIEGVDSSNARRKKSKEKTMRGKILYSPKRLNKQFTRLFEKRGWEKKKVACDYPTEFYLPDYKPKRVHKGAFREMDFLKDGLGVEVQFGKYAFMVYNVCAKMTIFSKLGHIKAGVEIVPLKEFADEMSSGVSYFEQFLWDLEQRGVSNIDVPVLIIGIR